MPRPPPVAPTTTSTSAPGTTRAMPRTVPARAAISAPSPTPRPRAAPVPASAAVAAASCSAPVAATALSMSVCWGSPRCSCGAAYVCPRGGAGSSRGRCYTIWMGRDLGIVPVHVQPKLRSFIPIHAPGHCTVPDNDWLAFSQICLNLCQHTVLGHELCSCCLVRNCHLGQPASFPSVRLIHPLQV